MIIDHDEKRRRRVARILGSLISRRDFIAGLAAAGIALNSVDDVFGTAVTDYISALTVLYGVFEQAAGGSTEVEASSVPIDAIARLPVQWDHNNPNDGSKPGVPNAGPKTAREWLIWRVLPATKAKMTDPSSGNATLTFWTSESDYVLLRAAQLGRLASKNAGWKLVKQNHAFNAFSQVRNDVLRQKVNIFDAWCL
jgi:hypothetical protein